MGQNNVYPNQRSEFSSGPSVHEIAAALERITLHKEPHPQTIDATSRKPQDVAAARQRHEALSKQWQAWWDRHHGEFVTDDELASLKAHLHDKKMVESAGIAALGPLFPTGAPYHLGPIHDIFLHAQGGADVVSFIDFDSEQTMSSLDACRLLPVPTTSPTSYSPIFNSDTAGIDAMCGTYIAPHNGRFYDISPLDTPTWRVPDDRWNTLEDDIAAGRNIVPPDARTGGSFSSFDPATDEMDMTNAPRTFLFRTREGGAGIIQTLGSENAKLSAHFRYRMVQPHPRGFVAKQPATLPTSVPFGPVVDITLAMPAAGAACAFDLDTGKTLAAPADIGQRKYTDLLTWLQTRSAGM